MSDDKPPESTQPPHGGLRRVTVAPASVMAPESGTPAPASDPMVGFIIDGRYRVDGVLGEGGMGVVYRCTHKIIGKKVAMKVLRADMARDTEVTERFLNEAKSASSIGNAHIIDISDFGQLPDGSTYFVMEFLEGIPLTKAIEGGTPLPVARILKVATQLAEGLAAAHEAGIVHRDLKPDNIYLINRGNDRDFVKILDFGIAKVSSAGGEKLTKAGAVFGTPHYMSPEQAAGAPIDHRCDIYAMGVILYELASGKVPFDADNFMGILTQHMYKAPVPMRALVPAPDDVPPGLEAVVLKCLSKRPEQRYQTMRELLDDLEKLERGTVPVAVNEMMERSGGFNVPADYFKSAMPQPVPATPGQRGGRSRWPLIAGLAGVAAAVGIVVMVFARSSSSGASSGAAAPPAAAPSPAVATAAQATTAAPAVAAPSASATASKQVILAIDPLDAHAFQGDKDLGASPVVIDLAPGATATLEIRKDGFRTETLTLDGTEARRSIALQKERPAGGGVAARPAPRPTAAPAVKPKPKPAGGGGEIVNPWD